MRSGVWPVVVSSLCVSIATTACSVQYRPGLRYSGKLTATAASCPKTHGTLIIQRDQVVFTPEDGTWTLEGKVVGATVQASRSRPGIDHKTYATKLDAALTATQVTGTYTTPTCTYAVDLARF